MELYTGASGFDHEEWKGPFYPSDLSDDAMLGWYAQRLGAVEMDRTFQGLPERSTLESWAEEVPEAFRFSLVAPGEITHVGRLGEEAADETARLVERVAGLGGRLGTLVFRLPPDMRADVERLGAFLERIPEGMPAAFELGHPSWDDGAVRALLQARKVALVCADTPESEGDEPVRPTTHWGYLSLRRPGYGEEALRRWVEVVRAQEWDRAFVFFGEEEAGAAPRLARRFRELFQAG